MFERIARLAQRTRVTRDGSSGRRMGRQMRTCARKGMGWRTSRGEKETLTALQNRGWGEEDGEITQVDGVRCRPRPGASRSASHRRAPSSGRAGGRRARARASLAAGPREMQARGARGLACVWRCERLFGSIFESEAGRPVFAVHSPATMAPRVKRIMTQPIVRTAARAARVRARVVPSRRTTSFTTVARGAGWSSFLPSHPANVGPRRALSRRLRGPVRSRSRPDGNSPRTPCDACSPGLLTVLLPFSACRT